MRRRREKEKRQGQKVVREKVAREVTLPDAITIQDLAQRMSERAVDVIKLLMKQGQMMKINDIIDADTAELIAVEMGHTVKRVSEADVEEGLFTIEDDDTALVSRPPVVTIMGHVDHGKTSLLDALRKANVASGEAGGITQHIGAYQVEQNGQKVTFIDTPGHAAFTQMRARGAKSTDVVILVVAADDGVMPQTKEAIVHAKAAGVPLIIAINKMDKPGADPSRVRNDLLREDLVVETMGGDVIDVEVSAKAGTNLDKLIEMILLQAEVLELKANPDRMAEGTVIEAKLDKGRGPVATVLVQKGTLKVGDIVIAGSEWGRVRAMLDENGKQVKEAGPSKPVEVLGFQSTPSAGDMVAVVENEGRAREISEYRQRQKRDQIAARIAGSRGSLEAMMKGLQEEGKKRIPAHHQVRCAGFCRSNPGCSGRTGQRRSRCTCYCSIRGWYHRERYHAGDCLQGSDHGVQRSCKQTGSGSCTSRRRRNPLLQRDLRSHRRCEVHHVWHACSRTSRNVPRLRRYQRDLQHHQNWSCCRLSGYRRCR